MPTFSKRVSCSLSANAHAVLLLEKQRAGTALLDLTNSNPTLLEDYPHDRIRDALGLLQDFTYHPEPRGSLRARQAISNFYADEGFTAPPSRILLTASTSEAYGLLFKLLCDPGDEILTPAPSYPLFDYLAASEAIRIVPYQLRYDGSWSLDLHDLRARLSARSRAILVVNPNNPTGSFLKRDEWEKVAALAQNYEIPVIADEVFMSYPLRDDPARIGSLTGDDRVLSFSLNGFSKLAGMPQMKLGWIVINGPSEQREQAETRLELLMDTYLSVNTPVQLAASSLLDIGADVRASVRQLTRNNLRYAVEAFAGTPVTALHTEGGWSIILRLPETQPEEQWIAELLRDQDVVLQPGFFFDLQGGAYAVASLLTPTAQFSEAIERIKSFVMSRC